MYLHSKKKKNCINTRALAPLLQWQLGIFFALQKKKNASIIYAKYYI